MKTRVMAIVIIALLASPGGSGSQQQQSEDELQEFVPSEEVSPDLSISFPVDI